MTEQNPNLETALEGLDQNKRRTLMRLIGGSAFAAPVVASFAMQGMSIRPADASGASSKSDLRLKRDVVRIARRAAAAFTASSISGAMWSMSERSHRKSWNTPPMPSLPDPAGSWRSITARWE